MRFDEGAQATVEKRDDDRPVASGPRWSLDWSRVQRDERQPLCLGGSEDGPFTNVLGLLVNRQKRPAVRCALVPDRPVRLTERRGRGREDHPHDALAYRCVDDVLCQRRSPARAGRDRADSGS